MKTKKLFTKKRLQKRLNNFRKWMILERGMQEYTIEISLRMITKILKRFKTLLPSRAKLEDYVLEMIEYKYSSSYIANVQKTIENYYQFRSREIKFKRPKKKDKVIFNTLSEAEIAVIVNAAKNARERAMISLLAYTGIRNREFCNIRVGDVDLGNNFVQIINGKGMKDRIAFMTGQCSKNIMRYLIKIRKKDDDFLFTTLRENNKYSTYNLRRLVKRIVSRTKIYKKVYPHLFRHSLATNMLERGSNPITIQKILGHKYIQTTMIYVNSSFNNVQWEYNRFAPSYG